MEACTCQLCDTDLGNVTELMQHILLHLGQEPHSANLKKNFSEYVSDCESAAPRHVGLKVKQHPLTSTGHKSYKCHLCNKIYKEFASHWRMHTGEKPYKCDFCDKAFTRQSYLSKHRSRHTSIKQRCDFCDRAFVCPGDLVRHNIEVHSGQRPHKCDICDKAFKRPGALKSHTQAVHTSQKIFKCNICQEKFTKNDDFVRHCKFEFQRANLKKSFNLHDGLEHHSLTNEVQKCYKCDLCDKIFKERKYLVSHWKMHTREKAHKCDFCDKAFTSPCLLEKHRLRHTGIRQRCDFCDKGFVCLRDLMRHQVEVHTDQRPYECDICDKTFKRRSALKSHIRVVHTSKPKQHMSEPRNANLKKDSSEYVREVSTPDSCSDANFKKDFHLHVDVE